VEKRLLLDGIALHSTHIAPGNKKFSVLVVADFADSGLTFGNRTAVSAGKAAHSLTNNINGLVQIAFANMLVKDFAKRRQSGQPLPIF